MNALDTADTSLWFFLLGALFLVVLLLFVVFLVLRGARKRMPASDEQALAIPPVSPVAASFSSALATLRTSVTGGSFQYRVPWTLMVGTPGSGKTSILNYLANAALPSGDGQTHNGHEIAWGFLNNGVLIDIPGSLLLGPAAGVASDENGWNQLLRRLTRHRPARPLDSLVLTIAADELLDKNIDISARGGLIRAKLDQLQSAIGLVLPVYILVTKCDFVRGFASYCAEIESSRKQEIFGWSNNHTLDAVFTWVWVDEAMASVRRALHQRQFEFFGAPRTLESPDDLYLFPSDLDALRDPLQTLLTQLFVPVSYRDAHYFRGLYFCGLPGEVSPASAGTQLLPVPSSGVSRLPLAFLDHLFDRKVFAEKALAKPVAQRFFFRNRIVATAQVFAAIFSLVMVIGLSVDANRLLDDKKKIWPVIQDLQKDLEVSRGSDGVMRADSAARNEEDAPAALSRAYNLLQMMAYLHKESFSSVFMPASWRDPIGSRIEGAVTEGFASTVLGAFQLGLEKKYSDLTGTSAQTPVPDEAAPVRAPSPADSETSRVNKILGIRESADLLPVDNQQYQALRVYVDELKQLEHNIAVYNDLKGRGSGTVGDVRSLLEYLSGQTLPSDDLYRNNIFFTRGVENASWTDIPGLADDRNNAAVRTEVLIRDFYTQWFVHSKLGETVDRLSDSVSGIEQTQRPSASGLRMIGEAIAGADIVFSDRSIEWLEQPFTRQYYPALAELDDPALAPVFSLEFKDTAETEGRTAQQDLRQRLLGETAPYSGPMLETTDNDRIQMAGAVRALGVNLIYLGNQDFMARAGSVTSSAASNTSAATQTPVLWNTDLLTEALDLNTSWQKYQRDVLPTVPGSLKAVIKSIGQQGLGASMADIVSGAHAPLDTADDPLTAELKNFDQALEKLKQLQSIGEKLGQAGAPLTADLNLYGQATRLLTGMNAQMASRSFYSWQKDGPRKWDGSVPLSQVLYLADSPDEVAAAVDADHDRMSTLVTSVDPLVQVVAAGRLSSTGTRVQTVDWDKLKTDLRDFGDKKPGNPIATLENFLKVDVDKIVQANQCQSAAADSRTSDPFIAALNNLRTDSVRACLQLVRQRYTAIADNFTQHLAGKFPFSSDATAASEVNPVDVADFFELYSQTSTGLSDSLDRLGVLDPTIRANTQQAKAFLGRIAAIQPIFATADRNSLPALDVTVQFRSNEGREIGGLQIIDWELKIGEQSIQAQSAPHPLRWHYGDRLTLTLRYAKDSPYEPVANDASDDAQIADRRVVYDYKKNWSLMALMLRHPALTTDFANTQAALPNTVRLTFGNKPGLPGVSAAKSRDTLVFVTFGVQPLVVVPPAVGKDATPKDAGVQVSGFPVSAPVIP